MAVFVHFKRGVGAQKYLHGRVAGGDSAVIRFPRGFQQHIIFHGVQFDRHMRKSPESVGNANSFHQTARAD